MLFIKCCFNAMFFGEEIFKGLTSHIGHVNTILYAFTEPNSKETCYNQLSPLEEITEVVKGQRIALTCGTQDIVLI